MNKDIVQQLSKYTDDRTLVSLLRTNRNLYYNEDLLRAIFLRKYPQLRNLKTEWKSCRTLLLKSISIIAKMKEKYGFDFYKYNEGNPEGQYEEFIHLRDANDMNEVLSRGATSGELALVKYALDNGADIHRKGYDTLTRASSWGNLNVVKYLVERGVKLYTQSLNSAIEWGHPDIFKYLVDHGVKIYTKSLKLAIKRGYLDIVKYLIEHGADIHAIDDRTLEQVREWDIGTTI